MIASALALATHYYAVLAIVPQAVWLLAAHWHRRRVQVAIGVVGLCGLALIPLALSQNSTGNASWIAPIPLGPRLGQIIPQFLIGTGSPILRTCSSRSRRRWSSCRSCCWPSDPIVSSAAPRSPSARSPSADWC